VVWKREPSLPAAIEEAWSRRIPGQDLGDIASSLSVIMENLYKWKRAYFKSLKKEIEKKRGELEAIRQLSDDASVATRIGLEKEMDELLYREEIMWMQRSRISWLREGDRNTKYFHPRASWRRRKNKVRCLKREDGSWTMDSNEMGNLATQYF
jgi:hypothetical protein